MTEELGSIGVKLRVDLSDLDRAETQAKKRIAGIAREHTISFKVGAVNTSEVQSQIRKIAAGKLDVKIGVSLPANAGRMLHAQLQSQLKAAGPVKVKVTADLSTAEINRIKTELSKAGGFRVTGGGGGGGGGGTSPSAPLTPHERRAHDDLATKTGRAVRGGGATPTATAAPAKPVAAASPTATVAPAAPVAAVERTTRAAKAKAAKAEVEAAKATEEAAKATTEAAVETKKAATKTKAKAKAVVAAPPPRGPGLDKPLADFGTLPTGPATGVAYRANPETGRREVAPQGTRGIGKRLARASQRQESAGVSLNTMKAEKARPQAPGTPEEIEYASRPTQVHLPLDERGEFEMEKRGRGVRGANRSGARQRGEPVLTRAEQQAIGDKQDIMADEESAAADERIRKPARRSSGAYYGSRSSHPAFARAVEGLQFYKFDPILKAAYDAIEGGNLGQARAILKGFSGRLAGGDPRQRRKFFKLFRNAENAPPEILEKHAAVQGLFAEISGQEAQQRVDQTEAELKPYRAKGSGKILRESEPEKYADAMDAAKVAKKWQMDLLRGIRRRGTGGRVSGTFPKLHTYDHSLDSMFSDKRTQKELGRFSSEFPETAKKVREIRDVAGREDKGGSAGVMDGGYSLAFNEPYIRDALQWGSGKSIAHRSGKVSDVVSHELGHLVDFSSGRVLSEMSGSPISGYGAKSPAENAAELFTQRHGVRGFLKRQTHRDYFKTLKEQSKLERYIAGKRAGGGPVGSGLMARIAAAKAAKEAYLVGETKPELFKGESGAMEIVGENGPEIRTFAEPGKIEPHVPEWIRRGIAKDLTRRAPGGPIYSGRLAAEPSSGRAGRKVYREGFEGERSAIAAGALSPAGGVQRVFVVNWPAGAIGRGGVTSAPTGGSVAAGPFRFASEKEASKFAKELGGHLGAELKSLLGDTEELKEPKEPKAETSKPGPITPEERVAARLEAVFGEAPKELRGRLTGIRSGLSETQQFAPVRSLAPAVGQQVATLTGRGELLRRLAVARDLTAQATKAEGIYNSEVEKTIKIQKQLDAAEDPATRADLTKQLEDQTVATKAARTATLDLTDQAESAAKHADAFSLKLGTLLGNTTGIIGGTLLFSAALGAAQVGLTAISAVLGPTVERMLGFQNVSAGVSAGLAEQTRQSGGAVKQTVALAEAQAGLSTAAAATISPLLEQRAQTEAGNKALTDSIALLHTFENTQQAGGGAGLTRTQGGLFGSILQGVPSTSEQVANEFANVPKQRPVSNGAASQQAILDRAGVTKPEDLKGKDATAYARIQQGRNFAEGPAFNVDPAELEKAHTRLQFFNDAIEKGGESFKFMAQVDLPNLTKAQRDAAAAAADAAGAFDIGNNIRDLKTVLVDASGAVVQTADGFTKALDAVNKSFTTPDVGLLVKQLTDRIIPAQLASFRAQGNLQRQVINPGQFALGEIAQPTPGLKIPGAQNQPFEAGLVGRDSLTGKIDKQAQTAAATVKQELGGAIGFVNDQIQKGHDALVALVPADLRTEFQGVLADITATGQQIAKVTTGINQQQVNLEVAEYNNQLRIARRSLQDAKDLQAGIAGETKNTVGGLEGQNVALQRQLQLLEFALQQRKINFQVAVAGFVAPGTTPEERAARIEEAKKEAEYAQKQLDIQKQLANNQFKGIQITTDRSVTDLVAQIGLLQQGRELTINTAVANKQLDILNKKQKLLVEQAGTYIEEGVKITQAALDASAEVMKQTGKGFSFVLGETAKAWGIFGDQAQLVLNALKGTAPAASTTKGHDSQGRIGGYASGIVGDTLGPTEITVGEAAGEKVAVLKNPKLVPSSTLVAGANGGSTGGGGGGAMIQMTVVISGNSVREESDLERLAERVAAQVEERLMRKTSLFGLRRA